MRDIFKKLNTPIKIQNFLDQTPFNFEESGETYMSPKRALRVKKMHCFEGALFACACLQKNKISNYLIDLKVKDLKKDSDHVICAFKQNGFWGAISKTNHSVLRYRDPIYKTARELVMSYYHEYFLDTGEKTLASFSKPFDVWQKFGDSWINLETDLDFMVEALDHSTHFEFVPKANQKLVRKASPIEIKGAGITEWQKPKKLLK